MNGWMDGSIIMSDSVSELINGPLAIDGSRCFGRSLCFTSDRTQVRRFVWFGFVLFGITDRWQTDCCGGLMDDGKCNDE